MTIYNFNLLVGYAPSGVDYAQGYRAKLLRELKQEAKFIFTEVPKWPYVKMYTQNAGILPEELDSVHFSFLDDVSYLPSLNLKEVEAHYPQVEKLERIQRTEKEVHYIGNHQLQMAVLFSEADSHCVDSVSFFAQGKLLRRDYFTHRKLYSEYFYPVGDEGYVYAKLYRRVFYSSKGKMVYEELIGQNGSEFVFNNNSERLNKHELIEKYLKGLSLSSEDWLFIDRSTEFDFVQPVFKNKGHAKIAAFLHSDHYFEPNYDSHYLYFNYEYYYLLRQMKAIDCFITSTQLQKDSLKAYIQSKFDYQARVEVIPVGSSSLKDNSEERRKPYSLMTASRLDSRKRINWLIKAVVLAKKQIPQLQFDIYGMGGLKEQLSKLIKELKADSFIHMRGHQLLEDIYPQYQVYLSGSIWETFGLTLLEAASYGLSLIGLNVHYGNQLFIEDGKNGYLVDYDHNADEEVVIQAMAEKIITYYTLTSEEEAVFHQHSHQLSQRFTEEKVLAEWQGFFEKF